MTWTWLGIVTVVLLAFSCFMGFKRGFIREVVSTLFVVLSFVIVWFVNPYVNTFIRENTPIYEKVQEGCQNLVETQLDSTSSIDRTEQDSFIENLELPEFLKNGLTENNTAEVYRYLAVNTFSDYVSGYLARTVVNGLSFLLSFLLATVLIRVITYALNILASLPVIHGINKMAGALLGGAKFVLFIWIALLILTVLCNTEIGRAGLELVEKDSFLTLLNERNLLVQIFMNIFYGK